MEKTVRYALPGSFLNKEFLRSALFQIINVWRVKQKPRLFLYKWRQMCEKGNRDNSFSRSLNLNQHSTHIYGR